MVREKIAGECIEYLLAFGGNLPSRVGQPAATIKAAMAVLEGRAGGVFVRAPLYQTSPVPPSGQPDFINTAARIRSSLSPAEMLALALDVEKQFGRTRRDRWSARTLDIDVLAADDLVLPSAERWHALRQSADPAAIEEEVVVPHPRLDKRLFVLKPLSDVAAAWRHPLLGQTVGALCASLAAVSEERIVRLEDDFA